MMPYKFAALSGLAAVLGSVPSAAETDADALLALLRASRPELHATSVSTTPVQGLFEVVMGRNLAYTDAQGRYLVFGHILELGTLRDLTAERRQALSRVDFQALPLAQGIKFVQGAGRRPLAVFSDPDCPYCRKLEQELVRLDDVTIHVFPMPIQSLHSGAARKAGGVWCSADPAQAWRAVLAGEEAPAVTNEDCMAPVAANVALAESLGFTGTPTLVSGDGRVLAGAVSAERLSAWLDGEGRR